MHPYVKRNKTPSLNKKAILAFLVSLAILSLLDTLFNTLGLAKGTLFTLVWLLFVAVFGLTSLQLLSQIKFESRYFKYFFFIFMGYGAITIFRGLSFSAADLTSYIRVPYIFWPFLIPFVAFFGRKIKAYGYLLEILFYLGCLFPILLVSIPALAAAPKPAEILVYSTALGSGFLLMNSIYVSRFKVNLSFIFVVVATLIFLYLARRAGLFMMVGLITASYLFVIFSSKKPLIFKVFPLFLAVGVVAFFQFDNLSDTLLAEINKRLYEDTRSTVVDMFYIDMEKDYFVGKGMNATYYCPIGGGLGESGMDYDVIYYRDVIENGYLQLMLSGGIVHIILFLLIAVPAAFNGIFRSANQFAKSCGAMILLWMIFMIGAGLPSLSLGYVLVWISIGVCYRKSIRKKTDEEIIEAFTFRGVSPKKGHVKRHVGKV